MSDYIPPRVPPSDFPSDVLKWMKQNAEPKLSLKLMKCLKYFQHQDFPYCVVTKTGYDNDQSEWYFVTLNDKVHDYTGFESIKEIPKKLWMTGSLRLINLPHITLNFIPKIAVCDIIDLMLDNQEISFNEFKFLTAAGNVRNLNLYDTTIKFENDDSVFIVDILKCVPNVKSFVYYNHELPILSIDFINTYKDVNASKTQKFELQMNSFNTFVLFSKFMDFNPHIIYTLEFIPNSLSSEETLTIEKYVQQIIDTESKKYPLHFIEFHGQSDEQLKKIRAKVLG